MKRIRTRWVALLGILASTWMGTPSQAIADGVSPAPIRYTAQDRRVATALNAAGDRAYRAGQFDQARKAYMNAYPSFPNAHAYLMAGDAYWRAVLAASHAGQIETSSGCKLSNVHFPSDVRGSLERHFERGLSLRSTTRGTAQMRQRASATAACLGELAAQYERQPPSACVDLDRLAACMGAPLIE